MIRPLAPFTVRPLRKPRAAKALAAARHPADEAMAVKAGRRPLKGLETRLQKGLKVLHRGA